jgi:hypothetical protein
MNRAAGLLCLCLVLASCGTPADTPRSETQPAPASAPPVRDTAAPADPSTIGAVPEPPAPPRTGTTTAPTAERNIYIDNVALTNPIVVRGRARTFENAVSLRIRDSRGVIAETFTTARGEMGHHNPFDAELWLTRMPASGAVVEAFEHSARDGSVQNLASERVDLQLPPTLVTLDFPQGDCTKFAPVEREVPRSVAMARLLVEALVSGPTPAEKKSGASSPFPRGARVKSVILRNGVLTIDFNERLRNVGGACAAQAIRTSVTSTLKRLPSVKSVVITAEGSEPLALQP